jgi:hypothetical protein
MSRYRASCGTKGGTGQRLPKMTLMTQTGSRVGKNAVMHNSAFPNHGVVGL